MNHGTDPNDVKAYRDLALAVVVQAANDLREPKFRKDAQTFLVRDMWGGWSAWLDLARGPVVARATAPYLGRQHHRRHDEGRRLEAAEEPSE